MRKDFWRTNIFWYIVSGIVAVLVLLGMISGLIVHGLWMAQLGYIDIFFRLLYVRVTLFILPFVFVFACLAVNFSLAYRYSLQALKKRDESLEGPWKDPGRARTFLFVLAGVVAAAFGAAGYAHWDTALRFFWGGAFGLADPVYDLDIGFYLFRLPFYELLQNGLSAMTLIAFFGALLPYLYAEGRLSGQKSAGKTNWTFNGHLSVLFILVLLAWAWGYYLDRFGLLYSARGVVYGAGYTDYHVMRLGLWIMFLGSLAFGALLSVNLFVKRISLFYIGAGGFAALMFAALLLLPGIVQMFKVQPNELELESPFLKHNIAFTRKAYQLDKVLEKPYAATADLTPRSMADNEPTLRNIRLWDWRPLLQTFRQTQEIRLYYKFYEVDIDRYHLDDGSYRQVMLSARELAEQLPAEARTWVNRHLQYTHGYGLAMCLVSERVGEGLPEYLVKDLPPVTKGLSIDRPALYYGEKTPGYRIVNTGVKEFDHPRGDENVYTHYNGKGGIPIDGFLKKLLFAWNLSDINILLSGYITPESRLQLWRQTQDRVNRIAPFLRLDDAPYLAVSGGRLYWIQDAYTVSAKFPYSEPFRGDLNYIRNSVKVIVDAFDGTVRFYAIDPEEPVLTAYRDAFPSVFRDLAEMPGDLKSHLRYPLDLFEIQAEKYNLYHMTLPQVFYNREDLWTFPREKYAGSTIDMDPYYILMRLPGEDTLQYILMTPLNPENRDNMIAWMAARCDFPDYGQLFVYKLPKERLIYGPLQIEAMIDQDDVISRQLSLWDQRGSRVIRGNLLVIPLDHAFLYVEPVYLVAEETDIPQLKRVIVVHGKKVAMEPTLREALEAVLGVEPSRKERPPLRPGPAENGETLLEKARSRLEEAEKALREGTWTGFGEAMDGLKKLFEGESPEQGGQSPEK